MCVSVLSAVTLFPNSRKNLQYNESFITAVIQWYFLKIFFSFEIIIF